MLNDYLDIRSRIAEQPTWYDCHGVPRYGEFQPSQSPNIYADEVLLYEIACQSCGARFLVEANWSRFDLLSVVRGAANPSLAERVERKAIHYGDPPCWNCAAGATMNCLDIRSVQFWRRVIPGDWQRVPELEDQPLADWEIF